MGRGMRTWLLAGGLYFACAASTIHLTDSGRGIAAIWPANAILLALLLSHQRHRLWDVLAAGFLANIAANLVARGSGAAALLFGACNIIEVWLACVLLRPAASNSAGLLSAPPILTRFILFAGLCAPTLSATLGALSAYALYDEPLWRSFRIWWFSDALGLLIFCPFLLAMFNGEYYRLFRAQTPGRRLEALGLQTLTAAVAAWAFFIAAQPFLFLLFAPVLLINSRIGRLGTKLSVLIIAVIGAVATYKGFGPVARLAPDPLTQTVYLQIYLAVLLLTSLPASADLNARIAQANRFAATAASLERREKELALLATTDSLTGVMNRRAFVEHVSGAMTDPNASTNCLVAMDLDDFKAVNDGLGHAAGDRALCHLTKIVQEHLRAHDVLGRIGGDEFMLWLPNTTARQGEAIATRLCDALRLNPLSLGKDVTVPLQMSFGISEQQPRTRFDQLAQSADESLYRAKASKQQPVANNQAPRLSPLAI